MNNLIEYFARQGVFVNLITALVLIIGVMSAFLIQREAFPNISYDIITVTTIYPGASSQETEKLITNPLEQDLGEVDGIKKMTSISSEGSSVLVLQLDPDETTEEIAKSDVQEVVDKFIDRPDDAEDPIVRTIESKLFPIIEISLSAHLEEDELRKVAKFLETKIESLREVAKVQFRGVRDYEIKVEASPYLLRRYQVSLEDMINALKRQNISIPGGSFEMIGTGESAGQDVVVRTVGDFSEVEDIKQTVVRANALAQVVRIKDIATVTSGFKKASNYYRTNGVPSVSLTVLKKESADAIDLVNKVKKVVEASQNNIPDEIQIEYINDFSYFIRRRLSVLSSNMMVGLFFVLLFLSIALPWKTALIASIGIPFSFLGTIAVFYYGGISLSLISMMGLIIVVGMLVDDAIVVTENVQRHMEKGLSSVQAAIIGTQEVWAPVTASVLTTVTAFLPLMFMSGIFGKFTQFIPMGVVFALLISLWECFFILPHHLGYWTSVNGQVQKDNEKLKEKKKTYIRRYLDYFTTYLYGRSLLVILKWRYAIIGLAFAFFVGSLVFSIKHMNVVLFPPGGIEMFMIYVDTPTGTPLERTAEILRPIEQIISELSDKELENYTTIVGTQESSGGDRSLSGGRYAQINVYLTPFLGRERTSEEIVEEIRDKVGQSDEITRFEIVQRQGGPPVGKAIDVGVRGKDYETLMKVVEELEKEIQNIHGVIDISNTYVEGKKEIQLQINGAEAAAAQLTASQIGMSVRAAYEGIVATTIKGLDEKTDIRVLLKGADKQSADSILKLQVPNAMGQLVTLGSIASFVKTRGIARYEHEANQRQVRVIGDVDLSLNNSRSANLTIRKMLPQFEKKYPEVSFYLGGEDYDTAESFKNLAQSFIIALMGIFGILILTFGNLLQPLLIVATIPFGVISVVWTFYFHGKPISFLGMMGVIALAGVVVNNAIVFVDFVNKRRKEGFDKKSSIIEAGKQRIRPIFLTTITTVAGIMPTAYGIGGLDPFVVPIALSLAWGILFGAFITTVVLPASISILDDVSSLFKRTT